MTPPSTTGPLILPRRLPFAELVSRFYTTNPFEPAWIELEKAALRDEYVPGDGAWCTPDGASSKNRKRIAELSAITAAVATHHLASGGAATPAELAVYQGAALYGLWDHYSPLLQRLIDDDGADVPFYDGFVEFHRKHLAHPGMTVPEPAHLLALLYQAQRAWYFAWTKIRGGSPSAAAVRAALWRASVGSDICAYAETFHRRVARTTPMVSPTSRLSTAPAITARQSWSRGKVPTRRTTRLSVITDQRASTIAHRAARNAT